MKESFAFVSVVYFRLPPSFVISRVSICFLSQFAYLPRLRSAHLVPYPGIELASEVAKIDTEQTTR